MTPYQSKYENAALDHESPIVQSRYDSKTGFDVTLFDSKPTEPSPFVETTDTIYLCEPPSAVNIQNDSIKVSNSSNFKTGLELNKHKTIEKSPTKKN